MNRSLRENPDSLLRWRGIEVARNRRAGFRGTDFLARALGRKHGQGAIRQIVEIADRPIEVDLLGEITALSIDGVD